MFGQGVKIQALGGALGVLGCGLTIWVQDVVLGRSGLRTGPQWSDDHGT